jgi:NADH:ubiquinone oxidoreductase subunit F (NADH-binding)
VTGRVSRVLPAETVDSLPAYIAGGGGRGLEVARKLGPAGIIDEVAASGLRGRGGGGFPTGKKWRTVAGFASAALPSTVVVNGAEGEPGTFKDRALMRANPYAIIEGALIAALAVDADRVVIAIKSSFARERATLERAIGEVVAEGWSEHARLAVAQGPSEYLFGEETGLLEVLDGRPPFPRLAPPFRHGVDEFGPDPDEPAGTRMAEPGLAGAPPTLVNNVETMANVAPLLAEGADWFRFFGTEESPGTIVCTVSGATMRHGVAEFALGTPLEEIVDGIGGGPRPGRHIVAAMSGVANPLVPADQFATPTTYEDLARIGSGLGAAGFIVFDDDTDFAAVAAGVSRFLAVESCGQCTPCKQDGLAIAGALTRVCQSDTDRGDLELIADRLATVADEARCFLAHQHQRVLQSMQRLFPDALQQHLDPGRPPVRPEAIVPILDLNGERFEVDLRELDKNADWTFGGEDSGKAPVERLAAGGSA